jgi:hypothetical protein
MLSTDDIVLIAENKQELDEKLEDWRAALESKSLRISSSKTEYLHCIFDGDNSEDVQVVIRGHVVQHTTKFKYLGSFIQSDRDTDCYVAH